MHSSSILPDGSAFTKDFIENFYKSILAEMTARKHETYPAAIRVKENYLVYLQHIFGVETHNDLLIKAKKKALIADITLLSNHKVIDETISLQIMADIDITQGEHVLKAIAQEFRTAFLSFITQAAIKADQENEQHSPKEAIKANGESEQLVMQVSPSRSNEEKTSPKHSEDAKALLLEATKLIESGKFEQAIESSNKAIYLLKELQCKDQAEKAQKKQFYQKKLVSDYEAYSKTASKRGDYRQAIKELKTAIHVLKEISPKMSEEDTATLSNLRRKLALAKFMAGVKTMRELSEDTDKKLNIPKTCATAIEDLQFSIKTISLLIKKNKSDPAMLEMQTDLDAYHLALADVYQRLTHYWHEKDILIYAMQNGKNVVDTLMPLYKENRLGMGYVGVLEDMNVTLLNLVHEYQRQNGLAVTTNMSSGYKIVAEIVKKEAQKNDALKIALPRLAEMIPKELSLFGKTLSTKLKPQVAAILDSVPSLQK